MKTGNLAEYEARAQRVLKPSVFDYFAGGAGDEHTLRRNCAAFADIGIVPRVLSGAGPVALETDLLGHELSMPVILAPTAFHRLATPEGEVASVRAARRAGCLAVLSMASTVSVEEVVQRVEGEPGAGVPDLWFQLYIQPDREFTHDLARRAGAAGCRALVVTVDSPVFGRRERDLRNGFVDLPEGLSCANMIDARDPGARRRGPRPIEFDATVSWSDVEDLRAVTDAPLLLKGVLHPEDARIAVETGIAGIFVSNHGGRQLDSGIGAIELLPEIAEAVAGRIPVVVDGGIRRGTDAVKALALGADAVALGRPILWGLAAGGEEGARGVLESLRAELAEAIALCGCARPSDLGPDLLRMRGPLWRSWSSS